eukprot:CAMPEP_0176038814 /NCGR_PEP_ID=MMETSP0120_2-20121206/19238_1 /TAXON_ID=160619 /ORGANISM="Kryptoperidinium foliaceum, Strain CCMP 1326" /LENGTH=552 /DNA_ID=CAMNT_0017372209 /DNA_START=125 /DNA_END=1783 /DNA_ORIENTATION=+
MMPVPPLLGTMAFAGCVVAVCAGAVQQDGGVQAEEAYGGYFLRLGAIVCGVSLVAQIAVSCACGESIEQELAVNSDSTRVFREDEGISKLVPVVHGRKDTSTPLNKYTVKEVAQHSNRSDLWIMVDGLVYDITSYVDKHPGGVLPMENMAGKDCTDVLANYHAARVFKHMLPPFLIGEVTDYTVFPHVADFRAVRQELLRRGLFETDMRYYAKMCTWYMLLLLSSLYLSLHGQHAMIRMSGAVGIGLFWQQLAGLGHDLGHSGVTHVFMKDHLIGSVLTSLMGISTCWWKRNHNTHHIACNSIEHDPDIQHMPLMAVSPRIWSKPFWSTYYEKWVTMDAFGQWAVGHQDYLFFILMAFARFNLYVQSLTLLLSRERVHFRKTELVGLIVYFSWVGAVTLSQATAFQSVAWLLLSHAASGLLHVQIVTSHWAMETHHGRAYNDERDEWYITQLKTTMNIDTNPWLDWVHIGLQFQIEHHLYPRLPKHNLRKARDLVKVVCKKHGIHYHEPCFFQAVRDTMMTLSSAAAHARSSKKGKSGFYESALWDGLTLSG